MSLNWRAALRCAAAASLLVVAAGCASLDPYARAPASVRLGEAGSAQSESMCARLFAQADRLIDAAGVRDAQSPRVPGFPYLRTDRFAEALAARDATGVSEAAAFAAWTARLAALDEQARGIELGNLPADAAAAAPAVAALADCRVRLLGADTASAGGRDALRRAARVPADYEPWRRALGLYPLTRIPFARGVQRWQEETRAAFAVPLQSLPVTGRLVHYRLGGGERRPEAAEVRAILERSAPDALGVPRLASEDSAALFAAFAPEIVVDEASYDDRMGRLEYAAGGELWVNFFRPTVYTRVSHALIGGRVALQLNYAFWFAARPPTSPGDMLAGRFDALIWRVTLARDGEPLVFDTIHHCGCYHLFIPAAAARPRPQEASIDEGLFMPQTLPRLSADERIGLRLSAGAHYLERVLINPAFEGEVRPYAFADDDGLRSLPRFDAPAPDGRAGRRSVFDREGFVPGSERGERFLFWPMGIANAGAMRQWGRHATAFVGMRHFDDPLLMDKYFEFP